MSALDKVRVSFIGAGGICEQRHLPGLAQIPGVELVAVCNRSLESSERVKQKWNFERIESDWRKVIDDPTVDAIFIGTWPYMHCELSIAALNAGKHVFCQARMCMDWNEAQQMTAAVAAHLDLVNVVCPSPFRVRWGQTVEQILGDPDFGELELVTVVSESAANADPNKISWRERIEFSGLNILQVGIYAETLNAWCGEYDSFEVSLSTPLPEKTDAAGNKYQIKVPQIVEIQGQLRYGGLMRERHSGLANHDRGEIVFQSDRQVCKVSLSGDRQGVVLKDSAGTVLRSETVGDLWQVEQEFIMAVRYARRGGPWGDACAGPDFFEAACYMHKMQLIHDLGKNT